MLALVSGCGGGNPAASPEARPSGGSAPAGAERGPIEIAAAASSRVEPARFTLHADDERLRFLDLEWRGWGRPDAWARGRYRYNTCEPVCTSGSYAYTDALLRLSRIQNCGQVRRYRRLTFRPSSPGLAKQTAVIGCSGKTSLSTYAPRPPK